MKNLIDDLCSSSAGLVCCVRMSKLHPCFARAPDELGESGASEGLELECLTIRDGHGGVCSPHALPALNSYDCRSCRESEMQRKENRKDDREEVEWSEGQQRHGQE